MLNNYTFINNKKIHYFDSKQDLLVAIENFKGLLIAMNAEKILNGNKELENIVNNSLTYCDGYGAVFSLKRKGFYSQKIPGSKLWLDIINRFYKRKSFYFLGSTENVIKNTVLKIESHYKNINIVGSSNGYFNKDEDVINNIKSLKPDIVFVALGSPKQEYFMNMSFKEHNALYVGLGGSFDLFVNDSREVPEWWNKYFKWEGLYRYFNDYNNLKRLSRQKIIFKYLYYILLGKI